MYIAKRRAERTPGGSQSALQLVGFCRLPLSSLSFFSFLANKRCDRTFLFSSSFFLPSLSQKRSACVAGIPPFYAEGRFFFSFSLPSCSFGQRKKERETASAIKMKKTFWFSSSSHFPRSYFLLCSPIVLFCETFFVLARRHFFFYFGNSFCVTRIFWNKGRYLFLI